MIIILFSLSNSIKFFTITLALGVLSWLFISSDNKEFSFNFKNSIDKNVDEKIKNHKNPSEAPNRGRDLNEENNSNEKGETFLYTYNLNSLSFI
mgnify:CR=1 FL=1